MLGKDEEIPDHPSSSEENEEEEQEMMTMIVCEEYSPNFITHMFSPPRNVNVNITRTIDNHICRSGIFKNHLVVCWENTFSKKCYLGINPF